MSKKMTGQEYLANVLRENQVSHLFYQEYALNRLINNLEEDYGVKPILGHSELAVGYMADGYARVSGKPGVCFSQSIGACNLAASIHDAWLGNSPVIAMTGCKESSLQVRNAYQESNHTAHFSGVTKFNVPLLEDGEFPRLIRQCFREVTTGNPRPAHIELSGVGGDKWEAAEMNYDFAVDEKYTNYPAHRTLACEEDVKKAAAMIDGAEKPVIVAGRGVFYSDHKNILTQLAEKGDIPVVTTPDGKTAMDENHKLWAGIVGGYGMVCANLTVSKADLVIYIGSQVSDQTTMNFTIPKDGTDIIQIDIEGSQIGKNYTNTYGLVGDAMSVMEQLLEAIHEKKREAWTAETRVLVNEVAVKQTESEKLNLDGCNTARLCRELSKIMPDDAILVSDTGWSAVWTAGSVPMKQTQKYIRAAGSLGWSVPASIGAKCAEPERPVFCFCGDGAYFYHLQEIDTAVKYGINTITILNNNSLYAQCVDCVPEFFDPETEPEKIEKEKQMDTLGPVNFTKIAKEFGAMAIRVEKDEDIAPALKKAMQADRPVVIEVVTDWKARPLDPVSEI
ncbi:thiamine pyrophosphate-binding protein [Anaerovorax odorimutans]|uniref:Thiamine pyrophosphate-binding protein n=1 Tax=Anaerovorax odorimutans TaxID=109327 RepID=A0ABT1RP53_9FIRM|nr:thiamine pyrophosphate-binding protein [Anaerovorax odorimutans]MCQ4636970.1 thiamine pyrophosphate-binding protein [Anaerovorax odorimutans]